MRGLTFSLVIALAFTGYSVPAANAQSIAVMAGAGTTSCGSYNTKRVGENRRAVELFYYSWAQGYLSRLNFYETELANLKPVDLQPSGFGPSEQIDWLNRYCVNNPSNAYSSGVFALYKALRDRHYS